MTLTAGTPDRVTFALINGGYAHGQYLALGKTFSDISLVTLLTRKNIYGFKRRIFNINNGLIRVMYNCFEN